MPPFRPSPPQSGAIVEWPANFGRRYTVFVDVEEEFDWTVPLSPDHRAVSAIGALPEAHRRFRERGVGLALMVDYPVTEDAAACDILARALDDPRNSLGAQLHAWVNPPYFPASPGDSYAGNLPIANEAAKLDSLTKRLEQTFGRRPIAYRAGRYGIGPATIALLKERGYRIDSSMRARYDYTGDLGPDFSQIGNVAFRTGGLLELPLTTVFTGAWRRHGAALFPLTGRLPYARGLAARAGLLQRVALTPEDMPIDAALAAVEVAAEHDRLRLLSFSFHSPSLVPGHTPYVRDAADLATFWRWWDRMFERLDRLGYAPASLDEILHAASNI